MTESMKAGCLQLLLPELQKHWENCWLQVLEIQMQKLAVAEAPQMLAKRLAELLQIQMLELTLRLRLRYSQDQKLKAQTAGPEVHQSRNLRHCLMNFQILQIHQLKKELFQRRLIVSMMVSQTTKIHFGLHRILCWTETRLHPTQRV